jgi:hypothetical protein
LFKRPKKTFAQFARRPETRAGYGFAGSALLRAKAAKSATGLMRSRDWNAALQYPYNEMGLQCSNGSGG